MTAPSATSCLETLRDRINALEVRLERLERLQSRPGLLRAPAEAEAAIEAVSKAFRVPRERILARSRRMDEAWARHAICHLLHALHGWHPGDTGIPLGRKTTTGHHSCQKAAALIETDRDFREQYEAAERAMAADPDPKRT